MIVSGGDRCAECGGELHNTGSQNHEGEYLYECVNCDAKYTQSGKRIITNW